MTTRSRSMSSGHGLRTSRLRMKAADVLRFRRCGLSGKLILARRRDKFFESNSSCSSSRAVRLERFSCSRV
ncbi:hypothetical protein ACVWXL_009230 [Bradyrhizobium sp. GM22.5]